MKIEKITDKLSLTNSGELEIIFIGTGTPFTTSLFNNNFIIVKGDAHIMVDFGFNAPYSFPKITGLNASAIECILPTHSHSDHIGGLEYLALLKRYNDQQSSKLTMIVTDEYKEILWDQSLKGGMQWNESLDESRKTFHDFFDPINPKKLDDRKRDSYEIDHKGIHIELFRTNHIPDQALSLSETVPSYGIYVDNRLLITCDTKFDEELIDCYNEKSEYIFHDCSFTPNPVHADITQLRKLDSSIKSKIYLMHYSDDWEVHKVDDFAGLAKQGYRYIFE